MHNFDKTKQFDSKSNVDISLFILVLGDVGCYKRDKKITNKFKNISAININDLFGSLNELNMIKDLTYTNSTYSSGQNCTLDKDCNIEILDINDSIHETHRTNKHESNNSISSKISHLKKEADTIKKYYIDVKAKKSKCILIQFLSNNYSCQIESTKDKIIKCNKNSIINLIPIISENTSANYSKIANDSKTKFIISNKNKFYNFNKFELNFKEDIDEILSCTITEFFFRTTSTQFLDNNIEQMKFNYNVNIENNFIKSQNKMLDIIIYKNAKYKKKYNMKLNKYSSKYDNKELMFSSLVYNKLKLKSLSYIASVFNKEMLLFEDSNIKNKDNILNSPNIKNNIKTSYNLHNNNTNYNKDVDLEKSIRNITNNINYNNIKYNNKENNYKEILVLDQNIYIDLIKEELFNYKQTKIFKDDSHLKELLSFYLIKYLLKNINNVKNKLLQSIIYIRDDLLTFKNTRNPNYISSNYKEMLNNEEYKNTLNIIFNDKYNYNIKKNIVESNKIILENNRNKIKQQDAFFETKVYCVICKCQARNIILECNHLLYCEDCIIKVRSCKLCNKIIDNYVKLFRC